MRLATYAKAYESNYDALRASTICQSPTFRSFTFVNFQKRMQDNNEVFETSATFNAVYASLALYMAVSLSYVVCGMDFIATTDTFVCIVKDQLIVKIQ